MSDSGDTMRFEQLPSMLDAYRKFITRRAPGVDGPGAALPALRAETEPIPLNRGQVEAYRRVCGIPSPTDYTIPLLYPQVLAGPLHAQIMGHPDFPFQAAGVIHIANTVTLHRPIRVYEPLRFEVELHGTRPARKGHEFDLDTRAYSDGECVWEATTTVLAPAKIPEDEASSSGPDIAYPCPPFDRSAPVDVSADQGRRYGKVSGDYNPIHLHWATAKLFGFKRAIAHGMWTLARCLAEAHDDLPAAPCHLEMRFKRPVYLPSTVTINTRRHPDGHVALEARDARRDIPHLVASIAPLDARHDAEEE